MDYRTSAFQEHRPKLYGIAYRMLGIKADAEDALQDAFLRWYEADVERVRSPEAWLTTTVAHLCIDGSEHGARNAKSISVRGCRSR